MYVPYTKSWCSDILKFLKLPENNFIDDNESDCENEESSSADVSESEESDDELEEGVGNQWIDAIQKIRNTNKKIRNSESIAKLFEDCCKIKKEDYVMPTLDIPTRWNSTHDMVQKAIKLKKGLKLLWEDCEQVANYKLTQNEWEGLEKIVNYLHNFKHMSKLLSSQTKPTLPMVVVSFNLLIDNIEKVVFELDSKENLTAADTILLLSLQTGKDKIIKHYKKTNWIHCVSLILDPRHKLEGFDATPWGRELKNMSLKKFKSLYEIKYAYDDETDNSSTIEKENANNKQNKTDENDKNDDIVDFGAIYLKEDSVQIKNSNTEIDDYFKSGRVKKSTDILQWWKTNQHVYPRLSKMARDILSIMATSVPSEQLFSNSKLILSKLRSKLDIESIKDFNCIHSWVKSNLEKQICEIDI